jgi:hypothetical protein
MLGVYQTFHALFTNKVKYFFSVLGNRPLSDILYYQQTIAVQMVAFYRSGCILRLHFLR